MLCGMSMLDRQFLMDHRIVQEEEKMATWKRSGLPVCGQLGMTAAQSGTTCTGLRVTKYDTVADGGASGQDMLPVGAAATVQTLARKSLPKALLQKQGRKGRKRSTN